MTTIKKLRHTNTYSGRYLRAIPNGSICIRQHPHTGTAAQNVLSDLIDKYRGNIKKNTDEGNRKQLLKWTKEQFSDVIGIVRRNENEKFKILPKR